MPQATSSAKKIARVQRAGVSKRPGQRRNLGFPLAVSAIIVIGSLLVFLARDARMSFTGAQPRKSLDSWVSAFNLYDCSEFKNPKWSNAEGVTSLGIDTKGDGLIYISPNSDQSAGENARFQLWADQVGLKLTKNSFTTPDGLTRTDGDECEVSDSKGAKEKKKGQVKMFVWPPQATENVDPEVLSGAEIGKARFTESGQIFVLAFLPSDQDKVPFPASAVDALKKTSDDPFAGSSTTAPSASTTAPAASTTAPAPTTSASPSTTRGG